jgi:iron complex outermembrane receptor protein
MLDLRVAWTDPSDRYTIAVAGKNVTGTEYRVQGIVAGLGVGLFGVPPQLSRPRSA